MYTVPLTVLAPNTAIDVAIQVQADSDFELQKLSYFSDIALAAEQEATRDLPLITVQITDTGTGRQMFSAPVSIPALFGDGRIPFILPTTKKFSANSSVVFSFSNYSAATTYNLRAFMIGAKLFKY